VPLWEPRPRGDAACEQSLCLIASGRIKRSWPICSSVKSAASCVWGMA